MHIDKKNQLTVNAEFKLIHRTIINMTIKKWESETCYTVNYIVLTGQTISISISFAWWLYLVIRSVSRGASVFC